jgi:hypothetical protein
MTKFDTTLLSIFDTTIAPPSCRIFPGDPALSTVDNLSTTAGTFINKTGHIQQSERQNAAPTSPQDKIK